MWYDYNKQSIQFQSGCNTSHNINLRFPLIIVLQCTDTKAVHGFIQHVTNRSEIEILIIGADCSVSSQPVAGLAPLWNLVQVRHKYISIHFTVSNIVSHNVSSSRYQQLLHLLDCPTRNSTPLSCALLPLTPALRQGL